MVLSWDKVGRLLVITAVEVSYLISCWI